jgi:phosphorylated adapter RNA export protein
LIPFEAISVLMEGGDSILEAIYEEDYAEDIDDVEMLDVEEELEKPNSPNEKGLSSGGDVNLASQGCQSKNSKRRANKKKNKKRKGGAGPKVTDINR